jgi:peptide chain release factor 3
MLALSTRMEPSAHELARLRRETARRRTFGIISHPDAGKTTLTERLLFEGGAIHLAGDVRARKTGRHAASDWMAVEQERGISVTSSVMQFEHEGRVVNLLDTPGHEDFSEDTYRVLTAVDSALMVIDSVKGVESRTRQLMEVCRLRDTPILSFINKLDREGRDALDLLADIEESLNIVAVPLAWPVGQGSRLRGMYLLHRNRFLPYRKGAELDPVDLTDLGDPLLDELLGDDAEALRFDVQLLEEAGTRFSLDEYLAGRQTPVLFGSALDGFGVAELLDTFVEIAPPPRPRPTTTREVQPDEPAFTGLVFKIQANMDPAHRDRMAFVRVCSGRFERGIKVQHQRAGRELRIANAMLFQAREREGVEEAFPGDIIGVPNHGTLRIGDTLTEGEPLRLTGIPSFAPEHFRRARIENALRQKQLGKGLQHLAEEGAIQLFRPLVNTDYVLGAVGPLQFDVISARLDAEYGVDVRLDGLPYELAYWVEGDPETLARFTEAEAQKLARDADGDLVFLAASAFWMQKAKEKWPQLEFHSTKEHT